MNVFNPQTSQPQVSPFRETYKPAGRCAKCGRTVFTVSDEHRTDDEPDSRGFAGPRHSLATLEDFPAVRFCWDCINEHGSEGYEAAVSIAKRVTADKARNEGKQARF